MPIFCDESGFTGNNMLNLEQPYFSYAAINIEKDEASHIVEDFIKTNKIALLELKGKSLLSRGSKYKSATEKLFLSLLPQTKIAFCLKKFSVACSFFEYIFEPVIAAHSSMFYDSGFHNFIAYAVYFDSYFSEDKSSDLLPDFENWMRNKDDGSLPLFKSRGTTAPEMLRIIEFASIHKDKIIAEFEGLDALQKWILDNSMTLMYQLICAWTICLGDIEVICDESNPLIDAVPFFDNFLGRKDQYWRTVNGESWPLIPHLKKNIEFKESKNEHGLQLADVMATCTTYALRHRESCPFAEKWFQELIPSVILGMVPDITYFEVTNVDLWRNTLILEELVDRSRKGHCLRTGMTDIFCMAQAVAEISTAQLAAKQRFPSNK